MTSERFNELLSDCKPSNLKKGVKAIKELYRFSVPIICKFIDKRYKQNIGMDIAHDFIVAIPYRNISYIQKLDPESCHIVTKCYIEGYSSEEVGAQLQMKSGTVRQKCARSLKKLRDM